MQALALLTLCLSHLIHQDARGLTLTKINECFSAVLPKDLARWWRKGRGRHRWEQLSCEGRSEDEGGWECEQEEEQSETFPISAGRLLVAVEPPEGSLW